MASFLLGAIAMACLAVGLVFLRFARKTGERLFLYFTAFFWIEAVDRTLQGLGGLTDDDLSVYVMRAFAFAVIIAGVVDKNLPRDRGR
jgi:hypothetical protein